MSRWLWFLSLAACTPDFADPTTVQDLRVLAVLADTPEVLVDVGPLAQLTDVPDPATLVPLLAEAAPLVPGTFPAVTLRPLVVDPRGAGRAVHFRVVSCPNRGTGDEPAVGLGMGMAPGRIRDTIDRDTCPEDSPLLTEEDVTPDPEGMAPLVVSFVATRELLLAALANDPLGVVFGAPITVQFTVSAGEESVVARKRVVFVPRLTPEQTPNRNPAIGALTLRRSEDDAGVSINLADPLAQPPEVALGSRVFLEPQRGETESYPARVIERGTRHLILETATEALRYAFFARAGSFSPRATTTEPEALRGPGTHPLASKYEAPARLAAGQSDVVTIWVVVRDERAGASYVQVALRLVP